MSVIVKGMEMPKNCFACACASYYGRLDKAMCDLTNKQLDMKTWKKERHSDCPLIELPPHGRLIDADATCNDLATVGPQYETMIDWCIRVIEAQPTVIEGSE